MLEAPGWIVEPSGNGREWQIRPPIDAAIPPFVRLSLTAKGPNGRCDLIVEQRVSNGDIRTAFPPST